MRIGAAMDGIMWSLVGWCDIGVIDVVDGPRLNSEVR
jgi:hypothetical protein